MRKSTLPIAAAFLLGVSGYALAESAYPQSSTSGSSSRTNPATGSESSSFPSLGAAGSQSQSGTPDGMSGQMGESQVKQRLEQQGYSDVTLHENTPTPVKRDYTGTAQKSGKQVQIEVDSSGTVTEK
jgi:hypothetical protein